VPHDCPEWVAPGPVSERRIPARAHEAQELREHRALHTPLLRAQGPVLPENHENYFGTPGASRRGHGRPNGAFCDGVCGNKGTFPHNWAGKR